MADINLKLTIDGKEAIQTLNLTEAQVKQLKADLDKIKNEKIKTTLETEMKGMPIDQARAMYKNLKTEFQDKIKANVPLGELDELKTKLGTVQSALNGVENESKDVAESFSKWGMVTAGLSQFTQLADQAMDIISKPIEGAMQFEKYETSLKVMLGSTEAAQARLEELVNFAASTPFELPQVIELGNQLQAIGKYSQQTMTDLGDLAAASGKPIEQVVGAFGKLATGQKGVAVDMFRDLLISTSDWEKAVGKSIDKITSDEMLGKLPEIMKSKGFAGMMEEQSKTLDGMLSNMNDSMSGMERAVGQFLLPAVKTIVGGMGESGNAMLLLGKYAVGVVPFLGSLGMAATGLVPVFQKLKFAMVFDVQAFKASMAAAQSSMLTTGASTNIVAGGFRTAGVAVKSFLTSIGPIGWVTLGVTALVTAMSFLGDKTEEVNVQMDETEQKLLAEQKIFQGLTGVLGNNAISLNQRQMALNELNNKYPGYLENLNLEKVSTDELARALETANNQYERKMRIQIYSGKWTKELQKQVELEDKIKSLQYDPKLGATDKQYAANRQFNEAFLKSLEKDLEEQKKRTQEYLDKMNEVESGAPTTPTTDDDKNNKGKKTFADDLKKLEESYNTSLFKMKELDNASKEDLLKAEKKFIEDKIMLYREYDKDKAPLIVELKTVITQLDIIEEEKFLKERKDSRNKDQNLGMMDQLEKEVNPNYKAPLSEEEKKRNQELINQEAELKERKEKFRISQMDNEFDRQRAMVDFEAQAELDKYKNYSNYAQMKLQIDSETADAKKKINEAENGAQISMAKETLGILATMVNENTALGKGIAIAQATINTYVGATKALEQGGIMGPVMMAVVIAAGMAQVQKIMDTQPPQMKGYERGGIVVGEKGPEIISPMQDYASGQARLINAVLNQVGSGGDGARMESLFMGFYARLESWQTNMQFQIKRGDLYSSVQKETFNRNRRAL